MSDTNSILNELESVVLFVKAIFPDKRIERQNVPDDAGSGLFVIRFEREERATETRVSMRLERQWSFYYFADNTMDLFETMDKLSKATLDNRIVIPIKDSLRYMRINNFSVSEPFETDSYLEGIVGSCITETRQARSQETFTQIMNVSTVIK